MSVTTAIEFRLRSNETGSADLGTPTMPHSLEYIKDLLSGTTDDKADVVWTDQRTLNATTEDLDVRGGVTSVLGGAVATFAEVRGIVIRNRATAAASVLTLGNGTNAAYSGLFGATSHTIKIPAGGMFAWFAPLDGGGLATSAGTADILKLDSGAANITFDIGLLGASA